MRKTWKTSTLLTMVALLAGVLVFASNPASARPKYRTEFQKAYTKVAEANKITCFACHGKTAEGKMDKEKRNDYAKALGKALGKKNETDVDAIKAALKKVEGEKSSVEGKTYGDLFKEGKLPKAAE